MIGGRYGLSSKEFTPGMIKAVFDQLLAGQAEAISFTIGIHDDLSHTSLEWDAGFSHQRPRRHLPGGVLRPGQ